MEWQDEGLVLSARGQGENSLILSVLTRDHGRHHGMVRGGRASRSRAYYQPGSRLALRWHARLDGQLGQFRCEGLEVFSARYLADADRLAVLAGACAVLDRVLPERDPHPDMFEALLGLLAGLSAADWGPRYLRWELDLLAALGFGLDLPAAYPRQSNQAPVFDPARHAIVPADQAGAGSLPVPSVLIEPEAHPDPMAVVAGLAITGHVLANQILAELPGSDQVMIIRQRVIDRLRRSAGRTGEGHYE